MKIIKNCVRPSHWNSNTMLILVFHWSFQKHEKKKIHQLNDNCPIRSYQVPHFLWCAVPGVCHRVESFLHGKFCEKNTSTSKSRKKEEQVPTGVKTRRFVTSCLAPTSNPRTGGYGGGEWERREAKSWLVENLICCFQNKNKNNNIYLYICIVVLWETTESCRGFWIPVVMATDQRPKQTAISLAEMFWRVGLCLCDGIQKFARKKKTTTKKIAYQRKYFLKKWKWAVWKHSAVNLCFYRRDNCFLNH